ncbi:MAG TPA: aminoglycoside phosphotransferase family protein [Devosiaceae bacterium]|nr:aminoglycoside phosphotransferase family protein [Devosiaceae bacterium]
MRINRSPAETALSRAVIRWSLGRTALIAETPASYVYKVERRGAPPAALKLFKPGRGEEIRGAILLAWYGGEGAARVYDADAEAVLMEWCDGPALASVVAAGGDDEATETLAEVAAALHQTRGEHPRAMIGLEDRFQALIRGNPRLWPGAAHDLFARAAGMAMSVLEGPGPKLPLHGDLHHHNVLKSARGWLAIDPKGLIGDPAYEVAPVFLNPWENRALCTDPRRIGRLASTLSARLGFERGRVLRFAAAHAALSACWLLERGAEARHPVAVLERLLAAVAEAG